MKNNCLSQEHKIYKKLLKQTMEQEKNKLNSNSLRMNISIVSTSNIYFETFVSHRY